MTSIHAIPCILPRRSPHNRLCCNDGRALGIPIAVVQGAQGRDQLLVTGRRRRNEDYELTPEDEVKFQREFQHVQEALALLSVVAHADYKVWRYLLETHGGLYNVNLRREISTFGQKEDARYGDVIMPRFLLRTRVKAIKTMGNGPFSSDLVRFCGPNLHDNPSEEYLDALSRIAALDPNLTADTPGVDIKAPVRPITCVFDTFDKDSIGGDIPRLQLSAVHVDCRNCTSSSGAPILWKFDDRGEPNLDWDPITLESDIPFVRTFSDDGTSEWVDAIIPGLGQCQVQRDDLEIDFCEDDRDLWEGLPMILATIGSSLTFLGLDYHKGGIKDILRHCPNLQELTFCVGFTMFRFNFSNYDGSADQFDYDWRDIEALTQALSDNDNPLAKCLRHLRVRFYWLCTREHVDDPKVYNPRIETDVEALLRMLQVNRSLEFLDVHWPPPYHGYIGNLREHHLEPISRPSQARDSKLALLSVILAPYQAPELSTDMAKVAAPRCELSHLDEYILSRIFEFAAPPVLRQVYARRLYEVSWMAQGEEEINYGWQTEAFYHSSTYCFPSQGMSMRSFIGFIV
ncbi:hypothetical protein PHYSODRAFT_306185 [Phytophthora sojae]|uniref:Uncharacterized protein n=1 Tax=Phytophthora sojae (strain P6497) TaxID=1094619 RepID=G5A8A3_PHYSP|nr:hypothetical protein PHYSODRAFT_306185 [Phytophthora sojae]EGZ08129.1 hypothetical protein PHYSODRAFT_306185 [Phytophthora sojae]|eukprot:XP_009536301.1 hypothetical protein PHYSODRAFT_306185 [Phytophthora sojae]